VRESDIYRIRLTSTGHVRSFVLVRGGSLPGRRVQGIAVTPGGSEIAVMTYAGSLTRFPIGIPPRVTVINPTTGIRATWNSAPPTPGTTVFWPQQISLTSDGRTLAFLTQAQCFTRQNGPPCQVRGGPQMRVVSPAAGGGDMSKAHVLIRLSSRLRLSAASVLAGVIGPAGSTVTLAIGGNLSGPSPPDSVTVVRVPVSRQRPNHIVYRLAAGDGYSFTFFSADPLVRHFLLGAGTSSRNLFGRIERGRLIHLPPAAYTVEGAVW